MAVAHKRVPLHTRSCTAPARCRLERPVVSQFAKMNLITQTESKIRRESIRGEDHAIRAHAQVRKEVRDAIRRVGNTMPENLPPEPPIKEIEKRLKPLKKLPPATAT